MAVHRAVFLLEAQPQSGREKHIRQIRKPPVLGTLKRIQNEKPGKPTAERSLIPKPKKVLGKS